MAKKKKQLPTPAEMEILMNRPLGANATAAFIQALTTYRPGDIIEVQLRGGPIVAKTTEAAIITESPPESKPKPS